MLRSRLFSVVVLTLCAVPLARGDDPKPPTAPPTPQQLIETVQRDLNKKLSDLAADVAALKAQASRLEAAQGVLADSWVMRNQIDSLQAELGRLREQLAAAERPSTSGFGPAPGGFNRMPPAADGRRESYRLDDGSRIPAPRESLRPALGMVRVINRSLMDREILVNGRPHLIGAGTSLEVSVPAGEFSYEVVGLTPLTIRDLAAGRSKTININW